MYENLLAEMARKGYTRTSMAKSINVAGNTFWKKMNGITLFNIREIKLICTLLEGDFEYLFNDFPSEKTA